MAKQCVVNKIGDQVESVIVKNYDNLSPIEMAVRRNKNYPLSQTSEGEPSLLYGFYMEELGMSADEAEAAMANIFSNEFGDWFGQWWDEKAESVSKVVDANGQPKPVWAGHLERIISHKAYTNREEEDRISNDAFFVEDKAVAQSYSTNGALDFTAVAKEHLRYYKSNSVEPVFLNIRNPKIVEKNRGNNITPMIQNGQAEGNDGFYGDGSSLQGKPHNSWAILDDSQVIYLNSFSEDISNKSKQQLAEENDVLLTKDGLLLNNDSTVTNDYYEQLSDIADKAGMTIAHTSNKNYVIYFDLLTNVVYINTDHDISQEDIDGIVNTLKEKYNVDTIEGIDAKIKELRDKFWFKESSETTFSLPKNRAADRIFEELIDGADYVDAVSNGGDNIIFHSVNEFSHGDVKNMRGDTVKLTVVKMGAEATEHNLNTIGDVKPDSPVKHSLTAFTTNSPAQILNYWNQVWSNKKVMTESASTNIESFGADIYVEMSDNASYLGVSPYDNYSVVKSSNNPVLQNSKYITRSIIESDPKNVREILDNVKDYEEWLINISPATIERMVFKNRSEAELFGKRMNDDWGIEVAVIDETIGEITIKNVETQKEIFSIINEHLKPTEKFKEYILTDVMQDPYEFSYNEMKELSIPELLIEIGKKGYSENIIDLVDLSPSFTKVNGTLMIYNDKLLDFMEKSGYFTKESIEDIRKYSQKTLKNITLSVAKEGKSIVPVLKDSDGNNYYTAITDLGEGSKPYLFNEIEAVKTFETEEYNAVKNELREIMKRDTKEPKTLFPKKLSPKRLMFSKENSSDNSSIDEELLEVVDRKYDGELAKFATLLGIKTMNDFENFVYKLQPLISRVRRPYQYLMEKNEIEDWEELEKYIEDVSTNKIYSYEYRSNDTVVDKLGPKWKTMELPIGSSENPISIKINDIYLVIDGNHRKVLNELSGNEKFRTIVIDLTNDFNDLNLPQGSNNEILETPQEVLDELAKVLMEKGLVSKVHTMTTPELMRVLEEMGISEELRKQVEVWHGSPHLFDRFSTDFMGSGEGMQAFGWGLYFTEIKDIAENYATIPQEKLLSILYDIEKKASERGITFFGGTMKSKERLLKIVDDQIKMYKGLIEYNSSEESTKEQYFNEMSSKSDTKERYDQMLNDRYDKLRMSDRYVDSDIRKNIQQRYIEFYSNFNENITFDEYKKLFEIRVDEYLNEIQNYEWIRNEIENNYPLRKLYNTTLHKGKQPSEYTWLEWDKEVPTDILDKIKKQADLEFGENGFTSWYDTNNGENKSKFNGKFLYNELLYNKIGYYIKDKIGTYPTDKDISLFLLRAGIDGVKFPAESISRGATSDNARGFNYVVFDENAITIEEVVKFQKELNKEGLKIVPNGFYRPSTREIYLNSEGPNILETMIHEFSHPFLQYLRENKSDHYNAGVKLIETNAAEAQPYIDLVERSQPNLKPGSQEFQEEVLAQIIGDNGARLVNSRKNNSIAQWLKDFWLAIAEIIGITNYTPAQISKMTLKQFSDAVTAEMFDELPLKNDLIPALAFQIEAQPKEFIPSQLFEQLSQQPFLTKDQALDIYKNIYSDNLSHWKDADMNC